MLDRKPLLESKISYYNQPKFLEDENSVNGFKGTWAFSAHELIPSTLHGFLQRYFGQYKIRRIPLDKINQVMNEVWEGPGSLEKVFRLEYDLSQSGKDIKFTAADIAVIKAKRDSDEDDFVLDEQELDIGFTSYE